MKKPTLSPRSPKPAAIPSVRIILVDDHPIVRERLAQVIEAETDLRVCGEAEDRKGALQLIETTRPDLAIVDLALKNSHGLELIKDVVALHPHVKMLVVSLHEEDLYAERVIRAGASGYITKQEATRNILFAIRRVLAGEIYLGENVTRRIVAKVAGRPNGGSLFLDRLTDRELEVFEKIGSGLRTGQVALELGVSVHTIETYRARIKEKLQIKDGNELVRHAIHWKRTRDGGGTSLPD